MAGPLRDVADGGLPAGGIGQHFALDEASAAAALGELSSLFGALPKGLTRIFLSVAGQTVRTAFSVTIDDATRERLVTMHGVRGIR